MSLVRSYHGLWRTLHYRSLKVSGFVKLANVRVFVQSSLAPMTVDLDPSKEEVLFWKCDLHGTKSLEIDVPLTNNGLIQALLSLTRSEMGRTELERRKLTSTLDSDTLLQKYLPKQYLDGDRKFKLQNTSQERGISPYTTYSAYSVGEN